MGYKSENIRRVVLQTPTKDECIRSKCCVRGSRKGSRV